MQTLKEVAVGKTVSVVKLHGEGAVKTPDHGYGNHQGNTDLCS